MDELELSARMTPTEAASATLEDMRGDFHAWEEALRALRTATEENDDEI